ncbi:MAG TPA: hypothetical protein VMD74_05435 [Candidatus Methylomirabilis sp.]|nr:hypothetical protein [Candidatus Methylomirabilis sp.]
MKINTSIKPITIEDGPRGMEVVFLGGTWGESILCGIIARANENVFQMPTPAKIIYGPPDDLKVLDIENCGVLPEEDRWFFFSEKEISVHLGHTDGCHFLNGDMIAPIKFMPNFEKMMAIA